ncbi:MAG: UbiE/COQ5 family methyltransferase [Parcubacteria group bacterium Athens0416_74]|nr:MAG: UbiE/COQ5 family methyltransferase [Parcubacteria group bacterium Athens0416_74]
MNHTQRVIQYYDATHIDYRALWTGGDNRDVHFGYYDEKARTHRQALARLNEVLAEAARISQEDMVLDAGCGYGGSAMWLAETYGCNVEGITLSPLQAERGKRYIHERHLEQKVRITEGDYSALPYDSAHFDIYWAVESLVHAKDRRVVLDEAHRVLKLGGRIVIAEYTLRDDLTNTEREFLAPWLDGWAMPGLLTRGEYKHELENSGFKNIQIRDATENIRPSLRRLEILSILNYPIALCIAPLFFRKERLENYYASWRQIHALKKGLWEYSIIVADKHEQH